MPLVLVIICLGGRFGINCPCAYLRIFSKIMRVIYPKNGPNRTCDYWLITPSQQTLYIELISFNNGQLQNNTFNGAMSITTNRVIKLVKLTLRCPWNLSFVKTHSKIFTIIARKMKLFSIKDFYSKCEQIRRKLRIWSNLLEKYLQETSFLCSEWVLVLSDINLWILWAVRKSQKMVVACEFHGLLPEAVVQRCSVKKVFLKILQNSQEKTCAKVYFLIKLQA